MPGSDAGSQPGRSGRAEATSTQPASRAAAHAAVNTSSPRPGATERLRFTNAHCPGGGAQDSPRDEGGVGGVSGAKYANRKDFGVGESLPDDPGHRRPVADLVPEVPVFVEAPVRPNVDAASRDVPAHMRVPRIQAGIDDADAKCRPRMTCRAVRNR